MPRWQSRPERPAIHTHLLHCCRRRRAGGGVQWYQWGSVELRWLSWIQRHRTCERKGANSRKYGFLWSDDHSDWIVRPMNGREAAAGKEAMVGPIAHSRAVTRYRSKALPHSKVLSRASARARAKGRRVKRFAAKSCAMSKLLEDALTLNAEVTMARENKTAPPPEDDAEDKTALPPADNAASPLADGVENKLGADQKIMSGVLSFSQ